MRKTKAVVGSPIATFYYIDRPDSERTVGLTGNCVWSRADREADACERHRCGFSRFVRISDSYVDKGDDRIVLKAGNDATITNRTGHHAHGAVVIGSERAARFRTKSA